MKSIIKRTFVSRESKYDNLNSYIISIDVKLRKPIQRSNRLSSLLPAENIPIVLTMGYLKVHIELFEREFSQMNFHFSLIISQVIDVFD